LKGATALKSHRFPTVEEIVWNRARREPNAPALEWHARTMLLGRLAELVVGWADAIAPLVPRGSVVALLMSNTPGMVGVTLALWRSGCVVVPLDPGLDVDELGRRLAHSSVDAVVAHEEHVAHIERALQSAERRASLLVVRGMRLLAHRASSARRERRRASADVAFHAYIEGQHGAPRAAILTHANVVASAVRASASRGDVPENVTLATHPQWDVGALVSETLSRLLSGGSVAILARPDPQALLAMVEQHRITDLSLSAELETRLLGLRRFPKAAVRSVAKLLLRDAAMSLTALRGLAEHFPDADLIRTYGGPETTGGVLSARSDSLFRKPSCLGRPHPGLLVEIRDPHGKAVRSGQEGEIACRGAVVMRGYLRAPRATREVLRQGWFHTGDAGYVDSDGELQLIRRAAAGGNPKGARWTESRSESAWTRRRQSEHALPR
jgi:fatty-acyl-CoA synthase